MKFPGFLFFLAFLCLPTPPAPAQQPGEPVAAGFFKAVNLVSLESPTRMKLDEFAFDRGRPVAPGTNSGTLALEPDDYTFTVTNEGATPASESVEIELENGDHVLALCYDERVEFDDGSTESKLRVNLLRDAPPTDEPRVSLVSLLKKPTVGVTIAGEPVVLAQRRAHRIEADVDDVIPVRHDGESVGEIEVTEALHYIAFLFRDPGSGEVALSLVRNERLEYHPPLEDEKKKGKMDEEATEKEETAEEGEPQADPAAE